MKFLLVMVAVLGIVAVGSANSFATTGSDPIFMQYGTIKGDATAKAYEGFIDLNSLSFSIDKPTTIGSATGFQTGAPKFSEITITKLMDSSSVPLAQQLLTGTPQNVKIDFAKTSGTGELFTYAEYDLTNAIITGYSVSSGGDQPTESITIAFEKFSFTFTPMSATGIPEPSLSSTVTWDLATNTPF